MPVSDINWSGLTHAMAFAALPTATGQLDTTFSQNTAAQGAAWVDSLVAAAHGAGKKVFLTIGGANTQAQFAPALANATYRASLVSGVLAYIDAHAFDGLDLDDEPIADADIPNLLLFIDELLAQRPRLVLSFCTGIANMNWRESMLSDANLLAISQRVTMLNCMTYGMAGDWQGWSSWHGSPLYGHAPTTPSDIDITVAQCLNAGVPAAKIGIGAGFFGVGYSGCTGPSQPSTLWTFAGSDGKFDYNTIVNTYLPSMTRVWDATSRVPYLWSSTPVGPYNATYISYDDDQSIGEKSAYIKQHRIGGMIMWHVAHQYFPGRSAGSRSPLLSAIRTTLLS